MNFWEMYILITLYGLTCYALGLYIGHGINKKKKRKK